MDTLLTLESAKLHYIGRSIENPHQIAIRQGITVVAGQDRKSTRLNSSHP